MNYRIVLISVMVIASFFSSCNKDPNGISSGQQTQGSGVISAYINGEYWNLTTGYATLVPTANLQITCSGSYGSILMAISPYNGVRSYALDGFTKIIYTESGVQYNHVRGQIQVTNDAPGYVEGTFSCELVSANGSTSLTFTDGQFSIDKQ